LREESRVFRHGEVQENGKEYWLARELMKVMGYLKWERFNGAVETGKENIELAGDMVSDHFFPLVGKSQGRDSQDYKLSRYAAYHTALACDGRKTEVALAKKYFVVKTRQAEVLVPQQSERIKELEMQLEIVRTQKYLLDKSESIVIMHGAPMLALIKGIPDSVVEIKEKVTETIVTRGNSNVSFEGQSTAEVAKRYGFKTGKELEQWLASQGREDLICQGMRAVQAAYIPTENLGEVKKLFTEKRTQSNRQIL
jgi:hypothetical protein